MMNKRDFLNAVIAETQNAELAEYAVTELQKMDVRNAKRSETPSKRAIANEPIKAEIVEWLNALAGVDGPKTASEIAEEIGISTQKASALCRQLVADGKISVGEVKVKGKGKQKCYSLQCQRVCGHPLKPQLMGL